jgi:hypothetical protein
MGESGTENKANEQTTIQNDKTPGVWKYRQKQVTYSGVVLADNDKEYVHWWYNRYIQLNQGIDYRTQKWSNPVLSIKPVNLGIDNIVDYGNCLFNAFEIMQSLENRVGENSLIHNKL